MTHHAKYELSAASIDLMDALLQFLLATTWQNERSNGLSRLRDLAKSVQEKLAECTDVFESQRDRTVAASQILDALQDARRSPGTEQSHHLLSDWAMMPTDMNLPCLHRETAAPYQVAMTLVTEAKRDFEAQLSRAEIVAKLRRTIRDIGERERFPFHVPTLTSCIIDLASRPGNVLETELLNEVGRYEKEAERLATNTQQIKRMQIIDELLPVAEGVCLQIDQSYSWSTLAISGAGKTSLMALGVYTQLNFYGLVNDARFSRQAVKAPIPADIFHREFNIWFMRASTLMFSGDDRETRTLRRSIVDAERADVHVYGKRVLDSLVLLIPLDDDEHDIERQLALLLVKLDSAWRRRHFNLEAYAKFLEKLPASLRNIVVNNGMPRKVVSTKKTLLFCLAGLIAENIYRYQDRHETLLGTESIKNRSDIDAYVAVLLKEHGFQYNAETLRRRRTKWRRKFLDSVPEIFGLDEA